jgi:LmbE family N-acetylglucosaminyl deacetylase
MTVCPGRRTRAFDLICLSPHYDDAVFSCGGLLHRAARSGRRALAVTVCAAPPPDGEVSPYVARLHARWGADDAAAATMVARRRAEDEAALAGLGVATVYLDLPDAIYRRDPGSGAWLYTGHDGIFGPPAEAEAPVVEALATRLAGLAGVIRTTRRLVPLAVGGHVDHQLVRRAAERAWGETAVRYYEDFPYAAEPGAVVAVVGGDRSWRGRRVTLDEADVAAKVAAVACYASQIGTFWEDYRSMEAAVRGFGASGGRGGQVAERLWRRAGTANHA